MKNKLSKGIFVLIIICFFLGTSISLAANYTPLIEQVNVGEVSLNAGSDSLGSYLNKIFQFGIIIIGVLAVLSIALAGLQYMTSETPFKLGNAKDRMRNAIAGIILALSAYIILNTINPDLVNIKIDLRTITPNKVDTSAVDRALQQEMALQQELDATNQNYVPSAQLPTGEANDLLRTNGIAVNSYERTSLNGLRQTTINGLIELKNSSGVSGLVITGGTEGGHAAGTYSHANGYKIDLGKNSNASNWNTLDSYIKSKIGTSDVQSYKSYSFDLDSGTKVNAYYEGDHWDLTFR